MHKLRVTFVTIFLGFGFALRGQYTPAEITRLTVDPETSLTTVYFTGTDHPDVTFYYVMQLVNEADGVAILSSYTADVGDMNHLYETTIDIPEVSEGPVGLYIRPYQDASTPLTSVTSAVRDSTMFLEGTFDWCRNSLDLSWNGYNRWENAIEYFLLMVKVDNETPEIVAELSEETTQYRVENVFPGHEYLFYILAKHIDPDPDLRITSNGLVLDTLTAVYPDYIHADFGTVDNDNHPLLQFVTYPEILLPEYSLARATEPEGEYTTVASLDVTGSVIRYTDTQADASSQAYYYKLIARNKCGEPILTSENIAGTIYLSGSQNGTTILLDWTAYVEWPAGVSGYLLERSLGGEAFEVADRSGSLSFTDDLSKEGSQGYGGTVCYRITAEENPGDPHASQPANSVSNLQCFTLPMGVVFSFDAFTPQGTDNITFGPDMQFVPQAYDFKIFNRNGNVVFHSDDPVNNPRWDGRLPSGIIAPQGVYRYSLMYTDGNGKQNVLQGRVTLIQ
ncbi:MAG: gliding motility-associated C-terminal domain-containing protein [Bacteroidales bacterium]|nr:gliding motility-associated C-terminal domain-containing protein [Bacteroidales bacterium]